MERNNNNKIFLSTVVCLISIRCICHALQWILQIWVSIAMCKYRPTNRIHTANHRVLLERSLVVITWLSSANQLTELHKLLPGKYYFTSLMHFSMKISAPNNIEAAVRSLTYLLRCDYQNMQSQLNLGLFLETFHAHYECQLNLCQYCSNYEFLNKICKLRALQTKKVYRLLLKDFKKLLEYADLNVRIILLVRDPRGTMQSRKHRVWCAGNPDCDEPARLCEDLEDDYKSAVELLNKYPTRFRTLRYEDLSLNPYEMTQDILQFYGLPFDPLVEEFLDTHTKVNIGGVSSTYRDSKSAPFHWKQDLKIEEINIIQNGCARAMGLWGYRYIDNFTDFQTTFDPMILPAPFT